MNNQNNGPRFGCPQCGSERIDGTGFEEIPYWCNDCHHAFWRPVWLAVDPDAEEEARREHRRAAKERGTL